MEECLGDVSHEVNLADGQVEILTFSGPVTISHKNRACPNLCLFWQTGFCF